MISKTRMQNFVKEFRVDEVAAGLREKPALLKYRDERGRNWLHLCASVNVSTVWSRGASKKPGVNPRDSVKLAALLLDRGIDVNAPAFKEGNWQATPLWYAVARGRNLPLARFLLDSGSTPEHCLWAACFHEDPKTIGLLVDAGAPLEAVAEEETAMLGAVKHSKFKAVELLLKAGANFSKLPRLPGKLGKMKADQWYFVPANAFEPHHGLKFSFPLLMRAGNLD